MSARKTISRSSSDAPRPPAATSETIAGVNALRLVVQQLSPQRLVLPAEAPSAKMLRLLGTANSSPAPPADFLENVRRNLVAASHSGQFSPKDLRYAPWLLWNGDPPAAMLPYLRPRLFNQARTSSATLRRLIEVYLRDFNPRGPGLVEAAACIRAALTKGEPRFDSWRVAQNEVHLFDPEHGPAALAARLLVDQPPERVLARYNLDNPLRAAGNYMIAIEDAIRAQTAQVLRKFGTAGLKHILQILAPAGVLRFKSHVASTGRALLRAWLDYGSEPALALQEPVRRTLLHWLGDPRLPSGSHRWSAVGEQETALMRRWLTRASLDLFFKLIDQHLLDAQWRYRHAFWLAYLEKGAISDAWLALGRDACDSAAAIRELGGAYGRLRGRGVTANQSALLLRIGPLVISEFTHNGKLRIWPTEWRNARNSAA